MMMISWDSGNDNSSNNATTLLGPSTSVSEEGAVAGVVAREITEKERKNISLKKE